MTKKTSKTTAKKTTAKKPPVRKRKNTPTMTGEYGVRKKENATIAMRITILPEHVKKAKCGDPANCVIAQALLATFGDLLNHCEIGSKVMRIITDTKVIRYSMTNQLSRALIIFDKTGQWGLPPGDYWLLPYRERPDRWEEAKRKGGVQSTFKSRATPTRRLSSMRQLCDAA